MAKQNWAIVNLAGLALIWDEESKVLRLPFDGAHTSFARKQDALDALAIACEEIRAADAEKIAEPEKLYTVRKVAG